MENAMEDLRPIHDASDYVGLHLYALPGVDDLYSSYRYRLWPAWFDRWKLLSTEVGIDGLDRVNGQRPGWRTQGLNEDDVIVAMFPRSWGWDHDGIMGGIWFAGATQHPEWEPYYPTLAMCQAWGQGCPELRIPDKNDNINPIEEEPMPEEEGYSIGQGMFEAMEWNKDSPVEDEHYIGDRESFCAGTKGLYTYSAGAGRVAFAPFV